MASDTPVYKDRVEAAICGAIAGEMDAGVPCGVDGLLAATESVATAGGFDLESWKRHGLTSVPSSDTALLLLRALPCGLFSPTDRPLVRKSAYGAIRATGADESVGITAIAVALLASDLLRFDTETALLRVRQSLLEEAPMALLHCFTPLSDDVALTDDHHDPVATLHYAVTALSRASGIPAVLAVFGDKATASAALSLAGALAGIRDGWTDTDPEWVRSRRGIDDGLRIARYFAERAPGSGMGKEAAVQSAQ